MNRLFVGFLLLTSCDDHLIGSSGPIGAGCTRSPPLTYETFGQGFVGKHCTGCHSGYKKRLDQRVNAPLDVNLDTWDDVVTWAAEMHFEAVEGNTMPPGGAMTTEEREQLGEWLRCEVFPYAGVSP